jgi:DegV family protein with EDD domain
MGLGALAVTAARLAAAGAPPETIVADLEERRARTRLFGTLATLEFLRRGGRIGSAAALVGSMLAVKPVIEIRDGLVEGAGKVRTRSRALRFLADRVARQPVETLAVLHGEADDLEELLDLLAPSFPREDVVVGGVGPVVGTHAGPGVIGVTFQVRA